MQIPIIMPQLGESIVLPEAAIIQISTRASPATASAAEPGHQRSSRTNKATMTVTSPCSGRIEKFTVELNESYAVGAVLGQIEATKEEAARLGLDIPAPVKANETDRGSVNRKQTSAARPGANSPVRGLPVPANAKGASYLSPRLKARMDELCLHAADLAGIAGSGAVGRVTVEDSREIHRAS